LGVKTTGTLLDFRILVSEFSEVWWSGFSHPNGVKDAA
jgi:hypothetical protein